MADHIVRPIIRSIIRPIIRALTAPAGGGSAVDFTIPMGLLSKLRGWYDLTSTRDDGWGPYPLIIDGASVGSFQAASTYGTGLAGNCLTNSTIRTNINIPNYATAKNFFLGGFRSTSSFVNNSFTAFLGRTGFNDSLSLSESATGFRSRGVLDSAGPGVYEAATTDSVDTWALTVAQHTTAGLVKNHKNGTLNAASNAGNVNLNPTSFFSMGTAAGLVQGAAASRMFWGEGEITQEELDYIYNNGAGRTISEIIADAAYSLPACRFTQDVSPTYTVPAISYSGTSVAHKTTDAVTCITYTNVGKTSGKHAFAFRMNRGLTNISCYVGFRTDVGVGGDGGGFLSLTHAVSEAFANGPFTLGTSPGLSVTTEDDIYMMCIDFSAKKVFAGKNGTWSGDPVAGTNPALTFTGTDEMFVWCQENDEQFAATFFLTSSDYPYALPTGYTPWGD